MAQPPNISETFMREVDENLRRDRTLDFAKKYGSWLVAGILLFLAAAGGWIYWDHRQVQQQQQEVETISQTFAQLGQGDNKAADQKLRQIAADSDDAVRASALLTSAAIALENNDSAKATAAYRELSADKSIPQAYRDLAVIRQTSLEFDSLPPDQVITRLQPLATAGNPWFGSAAELTAAALIKQGKNAEAGQLIARLARDKSVPDAIRQRSSQLAASLGVDTSDLMDSPAQ